MRILLLVTGFGLIAGGCATPAPPSAWGKAGVTRLNYGMDVEMCTGHALMQDSGDNGANEAGGISGQNNPAHVGNQGASGSQVTPGANGQSPATQAPTPAGGTYSGMASADYAERAATQQRSQAMAAQRARSDALRRCLAERGYQEFALTKEQRAHIATLKRGSHEYVEYFYQLGSDPEVISKQGVAVSR